MGFDKDCALPLYRQLMQQLRHDVEAGLYPMNSSIPSEQSLCEKYHVSRITVRRAIKDLSEEGLLVRMQGKGTFVAGNNANVAPFTGISSFHQACERVGKKAYSKVIRVKEVPATDTDVRELSVSPSSNVVEIIRLRYADLEPVMVEINRFSMGYSYLLESDLNGSLYNLLNGYGVYPTSAIHDISIVPAEEVEASYLGIELKSPLLLLQEVIYDQKGRPLHSSRQFIRGDRFTLRI